MLFQEKLQAGTQDIRQLAQSLGSLLLVGLVGWNELQGQWKSSSQRMKFYSVSVEFFLLQCLYQIHLDLYHPHHLHPQTLLYLTQNYCQTLFKKKKGWQKAYYDFTTNSK